MQVLGAVLLLGVMGVFASCVVYVLPPGAITCAVRQWAPPLCLALCYGILLVKSMHLRALVAVGAEGEVGCCVLSIGEDWCSYVMVDSGLVQNISMRLP